MKRILAVIALVAFPANAEPVRVLTGEHEDFTRIVLPFSAPADWSLFRTEGGYGLSVGDRTPTYDLSRVFDLIPKTRLRSIHVNPATRDLNLGVACLCHVEVAEQSDGVLVIDLHDGPGNPDSPFEMSRAGVVADPLRQILPPRPKPRKDRETGLEYDWLAGLENDGAETAQESAEISSDDHTDFRHAVIQALARGASQDLVRMTPSATEEIASPPPVQAGTAGWRLPSSSGGPSVINPILCSDPKEFDLPSWATEGNAAQQISAAKAAILQEFDKVDEVHLLAAIRTHVYFGFGAEARQMIAEFSPGPSFPILEAMAYIVDGDQPADKAIADQVRCGGAASLWAILADDNSKTDDPKIADDIALAFLALPRHLRALLGPPLARKLRAGGFDDAAEMTLSSLERSGEDGATDATRLRLQSELLSGQHTANLDQLSQDDNSVETLILRAEAAFQQRQAPDPKAITLLEAAMFTADKDVDASALNRSLSQLLALSGEFRRAFELVTEDAATTQDLWALITESSAPGDFLDEAGRVSTPATLSLPPKIREAVATRLLDLGLPELAEPWATPPASNSVLLARLALAKSDGRAALDRLSTETSADADDLRRQAYLAIGDTNAAVNLLIEQGNSEEAARLRRWADLPPTESDDEITPWAALADLAVLDSLSGPATLASAEDAVNRSERTLANVGELLAETALSE